MIPELIAAFRENRTAKRWFVVFLGLLLIILAATLLWTPEKFEPQRLSSTSLTYNANFGHLSSSDLYGYNGLAFYKVALSGNNSIKVLHAGTKLPTPSAVYWANSSGALLNFKESFALTKVEEALQAGGLGVDPSSESYTWYLDFASGTLKLVDKRPVQQNRAVFAEGKGFYYIPDNSKLEDEEQTGLDITANPLHFYNTQAGQDETISNDLGVIDVSYLGQCLDTKYRVCFIARDAKEASKERLYAIDSNNRKVQLLESRGRLFPTSHPDYFISAEGDDEAPPEGSDGHIEEQVVFEEARARLHNVKDKSAFDAGFNVGNSDIIAHFKTPDEFYLLDNSLVKNPSSDKEAHQYRAAQIKSRGKVKSRLFQLLYSDNTPFTAGIVNIASHGDNGRSLITDFGGNQLLFTERERAKDLIRLELHKAQEVVDGCTQSSAKENQYFAEDKLFKVFFTDDANLATNIKLFSDCIIKSDEVLVGYNFYFGALDPFNGRITTD